MLVLFSVSLKLNLNLPFWSSGPILAANLNSSTIGWDVEFCTSFIIWPLKPSLTVFQTKRKLNIIKCIFPSLSLARIHAHEENSQRTSSTVENTFLPILELPSFFFDDRFALRIIRDNKHSICLKTGQCNFYYTLFKICSANDSTCSNHR